jgi:putative tricarboxylic transport membrane protein
MSGLEGLMHGFAVVLTPETLMFALIGCIVGMLVGVLPGVGQSTGMALLIPITYHMAPVDAIVMLSSIFYGAAYGGTITSVLMNVPGESETLVTTFDGHPLAKQGRGGPALAVAAIGSFIGGCFSTLILALSAVTISRAALQLGPPEYFALMVLSLCLAAGLLGSSVVKGLIMVVFGLLLTQVGMDPELGVARLTFGLPSLYGGIPLLALIMGFFGLSDVLLDVLRPSPAAQGLAKVGRILPTRADLRESIGPIGRGSIIGFLLGLLPGMAGAVSTFFSYIVERRVSRTPEMFGKGAIAGVAGPETANNAFANASFLPLLTLGIPGSAALSILVGAFMIQGISVGPLLFEEHADVAWGLISSMIVGNAILLLLSLPLIRIWISILHVPKNLLAGLIVLFAVIGIYSVNNSANDIYMLVVFTVVGVGLKLADFPLAPAILAFVLGRPIEAALRQSLVISGGDGTVFFTRPISAVLLTIAAIVVLRTVWSILRPNKVSNVLDMAARSNED